MQMNMQNVPTPCYVVDRKKLRSNLNILNQIQQETGAKILLAQKAFSSFYFYPEIGKYLAGTTASGLYEARLGYEEMRGKEVHVYAPAYKENDVKALLPICDHMIFNTPNQWNTFQPIISSWNGIKPSFGLRINPEYSEIDTKIYNPCFTNSRLGTTLFVFEKAIAEKELVLGGENGVDGLHFHTLCEQNADVLQRTLKVVEEKFSRYFKSIKWINFGGGHHITREDYEIEILIKCIKHIKATYGLQVYLEPGEAVALNTGYLVATVLDIMENGMEIAILDTSAACHMPDVLEMPYRPEIINAGKPKEKPYTYRLAGPTCLAGDVIGDYSFDHPLHIGERVVFCDMAIYSIVKNNTFNGMPLPGIAVMEEDNVKMIKTFGYQDFKDRLS